MPIVIFTAQGIGNNAIRIFVEGVWNRIKRAVQRDDASVHTESGVEIPDSKLPTLHVQWCIERDGERLWFKADGSACDVLAALEATQT